jgi:hypothetical protein
MGEEEATAAAGRGWGLRGTQCPRPEARLQPILRAKFHDGYQKPLRVHACCGTRCWMTSEVHQVCGFKF